MGAYTPPQWGTRPAQVSITVPPQAGSTLPVTTSSLGQLSPQGSGTESPWQLPGGKASLNNYGGSTTSTVTALSGIASYTVYVFDAVLAVDHSQTLEKTKHPVQTGADISSHAYLRPATVALEIGMSDAMAAYTGVNAQGINAAPFVGSPSKSVSAYQTLLQLQASRTLLTVTTRLRTYTNMLLTVLPPREDYKTITGLRCRVEFEQILTGTVSTSTVTARPDATDANGLGVVDPSTVPASTEAQFTVTPVNGTASATSPLTMSDQLPPYLQPVPMQSVAPPPTTYAPPYINGAGTYSSEPVIQYDPAAAG